MSIDSNRSGSASTVILVVLLVVGAALRLYRLDDGLWLDEIEVYLKHFKSPFGQIVSSYQTENQHTLYSVLAHAAFLAFGDNRWTLRLPALVSGVGSLWGLYLLGSLLTTRREALFAVGLLTFSYHHIWFSQNARGYTGLLFWTTIAGFFFIKGIRENRRRNWWPYALSVALGIFTHLTMSFVVFGHLVIYAIQLMKRRRERWPDRWRILLHGFCPAGILTLALYSPALPQMLANVGEECIIETWGSPLWTLLELWRGIEVDFSGTVMTAAALFALGSGLFSFLKRDPMVVQLCVIPLVAVSVVVVLSRHPLWPRFFFFAVGFGALIVVRGIVRMAEAVSKRLCLADRKTALVTFALPVLLIVASTFSVPSVYGAKQDYRGAMSYVERNREPGDVVVVVGLAKVPYKSYLGVDWAVAETADELKTLRSEIKRTWLIYTLPLQLRYEQTGLMTRIEQDFNVIKKFQGTLNGGEVFVLRVDGLQGAAIGRRAL